MEKNSSVDSLDISLLARPFRNPNYKAQPRRNRNLRQIIQNDPVQNEPSKFSYSSIEAPPSVLPQPKYCDVTGLLAIYTDPKTRLRYHNKEIYGLIRELPSGADQEYLKLRSSDVVLK
ncbi:Chromatin-remodeling complex subunit ies6 [Schizosaccharomyces pombe]|uniref:Chromatin-remodeling complex subunit ies6 n=1 Tax=Schizosaccharomyces pombe (strain 972 / ATCC 24843) TaxID=284812 RepID=IES6_SCHPO|nr:Ino80 complex subunit Ies6 [Schizosaccharomyces pombe]Q9UTE8.1 RecName: Full=Chromatin-remodeling complex subunit ies6 [Schizosaccharomyces pombe 972h-]CAB60696.1 Ino80 complex subunit Ies6 [Schizosaccharomyces pombe]|eukprot:NP_593143.1 Ino80 complex subunit Ies6 [Schizosaccharomyces pombe]